MLIAVFSLSVSRCANEQNNAGTRLPHSLASVQRNTARRWLTHLFLIAPIVYPLPILTLCYLFSQEILYNMFPYLKFLLTCPKAYFNSLILENNLKLSCYLVYLLVIILSVEKSNHIYYQSTLSFPSHSLAFMGSF